MKKTVVSVMLMIFSIIAISQTYTIGSYTIDEIENEHYMLWNGNSLWLDNLSLTVKLDESLSTVEIASFEQDHNLLFIRETIGNYRNYGFASSYDYITICNSVINDDRVDEFLFDYMINFHGYVPDDPDLSDQWYLDQIDVFEAWDITIGDATVIVAVIDEGLFLDHDDVIDQDEILENVFHNSGEDEWGSWYCPDCGNGLDDDNNGKIDDWKGWSFCNFTSPPPSIIEDNNVIPEQEWAFHGTAVSGIISARTNNGIDMAGIAGGNSSTSNGGAKILPIRISDWKFNPVSGEWEMVASTDLIPAAIEYAVEMGSHIINMSFGGNWPPGLMNSIDAAIEYAYSPDNNVLLVASVGNEGSLMGQEFGVSYPATHPDVVAVGATDEDDEHADFPSMGPNNHSNIGDQVELAAPGVNILTLNDNSSDYYEGTSFSAPMVCATAALMLSINPDLTNIEMREILKNTAEKVGIHSYDQNGWNKYLGFGRINTHYAVCEAMNYLDPIIVQDPSGLWDQPVFSKDDIVILQNSELTITSTVYMSPGKHIIVEPGAKLIVDGGTLTNFPFCNESNIQWGGVEVWGNSSQHQYPDEYGNYQQGYIELRNLAVIENAEIAVNLYNPNAQYPMLTTGGIIRAIDATFSNNAKSIHALYYDNYHPNFVDMQMDYSAYFKNCTFEITDEYLGTYTFYKHVDLNHVDGPEFRGCDFSLSPLAQNVQEWNKGIAAYNSGFDALAYCTSTTQPCPDDDYKKCTFTGFYRGIYATGDLSTINNSIYVNRAVFNNNALGAEIVGVHNPIVINCDFNIGFNKTTDQTDCLFNNSFGIYLDNSTGFAIEENEFAKFSGGQQANYFGIVVKESRAVNEIYKNEFGGISYANYSEGRNWGDKYREGLAYFCNDNSGNYADFFVAHGNPSGIQDNQGNDEVVAGNSFSQTGATWQFYNGGDYLVGYYYCDFCTEEIPDGDLLEYTTEEPKSFENTCLSHYGGGAVVKNAQQKYQLEQEYLTNLTDYNSVKSIYNSYIDGGDTEGELLDIQTAQPDDMWALRGQLLGNSPHLSQELLMEASGRTDVFPDDVLLEILSANPDELKKDSLISYLENKEDPLPEYMIDILIAVSTGTTYKTVLEHQMSKYKRNMVRACHDMIRSILNDSVSDYVELRNWLDNLGGIRADQQIIASYIQEGNYTDAMQLANMLPQLYGLSGNDSLEHSYYMDLLNLHQLLQQQGRNTMQLTQGEIDLLANIADNSNSTAGAQARGVLEYAYDYHFACCPNVEADAGYKNQGVNMNSLNQAYGLDITVNPNPASQWATFNYKLPAGENNAVILITDVSGKTFANLPVSGKQGKKTWDTRDINAGVYIYTLKVAGMSKSGKIVITK